MRRGLVTLGWLSLVVLGSMAVGLPKELGPASIPIDDEPLPFERVPRGLCADQFRLGREFDQRCFRTASTLSYDAVRCERILEKFGCCLYSTTKKQRVGICENPPVKL